MLTTRLIFCLLIIVSILTFCCLGQNEIRNAVKTKVNRKYKEGEQRIEEMKDDARRVKQQVTAPFQQAGQKVRKKYRNSRRKITQIKQVINS